MAELPTSVNPWQVLPYGNAIIFTSTGNTPRIFSDGTLKLLDLGATGTPIPTPTPTPTPTPGTEKVPLYPSSVVGTEFDFITESDPNAFQTLDYVGFIQYEMPDKRDNPPPLFQNAYVFNAHFTDGTQIKIAMSQEFGNKEAAQLDCERYLSRLGRLPSLYRQKLNHLVVHKGGIDTTAFSEDKGHFFVIYSDNATKRISTHDLEETFFHEGSHASIQVDYLTSPAWLAAKAADNAYITDYAKTNAQEDFAESALFAYTVIKHPERLSPDLAKIQAQIPNRIAFFRTVYV